MRAAQRLYFTALFSILAIALAYAASSSLSNLSAGGSVSGTDIFYDVKTGGTGGVKVSASQVATYLWSLVGGDCSASGGTFTCTKTNGSAFVASATTDATNAANISSGTLPAGRMPALTGDCTTSAGAVATTCGKTGGVSFGTFATQNYTAPPAIGGVTPAAGSFTTLTLTGAVTVKARTASSTTDSLSATTDYLVCADNSSGAATESLPSSPATGLTFLVKDCGGNAATHNITVSPAAGDIDGAASYVMSTNYQSTAFTYTGSQWSVN